MGPMPNVAICCPTYCGAEPLRRLLKSVREVTKYDGEMELIVLDDGSPADQGREIELVTNEYDALLVDHITYPGVQPLRNRGIPVSWNRLTRTAGAHYIVLVNNDVLVTDPFWLTCLVGFIQENRKRGTKIGPVGLPSEPALLPRMRYPISGWCMGFHREVFEATGGFWEELVRYYEDSTFSVEAARQGFFPVQLGNPCMQHEESKTLKGHAWLREADIPEVIVTEIVESQKTKERYLDYCKAAGESAKHYANWVADILAINPRSSLSRYMFCKRFGLEDMLEHYHEETVRKYIDPLRRAWSECDLVWFESDGEKVVERNRTGVK